MAVRAKYQPFSFQERLTPFLMLQEQYDKLNENIFNLGQQANQYYQFLDPETKAQVDDYNKQLEAVAGNLATEGMKAVSRNTLNTLKRNYATQIQPIQQAAQTAGTIQAQIREMQMKDPTLMVQSVPSVKDLMENPNATPSLVSGAKLMEEGANAALMLPGVTYDQLSRYLNGDPTAIPDLDRAAQTIANNYGVTSDEALAYIQRGISNGLGNRATQLDMKQQQIDMEFQKQMALARYNQGQQNYRQSRQIAASQASRNNQLIMNGWVPDPSSPTGWRFDEETARSIAQAKAAGKTTAGSGGGRSSTQYMNRTKGTIGYNADGTRSKNQDIPNDAQQINDITKATTEEKVLALKHAGIPIEDYKRAGADGYSPEDIDRAVAENIDVLGAYRFWTTSKGKKDKRKVTGFWGTDTSVTREVDSPFGGYDGYSSSYGSDYYDYSSSFNELPEEY